MINAVVNDRSLKAFEPTLRKEIYVFLGQIASSCGSTDVHTMNLAEPLKYLTLDIVGHLALGQTLASQTRPKNRFLSKGIAISNYHNNLLMQFPFLAQSWLVALMHFLTARQQQRNLKTLEKAIRKRKSQEENNIFDLYDAVTTHMEAKDGEQAQLSELSTEVAMLYVAGQ